MDRMVLLLIIAAVASVVFGHVLEGGAVSALWNGPALLIVFGGSFLAVAVQTPLALARRTMSFS